MCIETGAREGVQCARAGISALLHALGVGIISKIYLLHDKNMCDSGRGWRGTIDSLVVEYDAADRTLACMIPSCDTGPAA